jgi:transcriptional regulator with PAS, ATPase and Fis domain
VDVPVFVCGESGVGKEVVARMIHLRSKRRNQAFIKVNCAALPGELLESELFGFEQGAFTGAVRSKPGKFELANKGTIFLDEIAEMSVHLQAKLLHVLQDHQYSRLGGRHLVETDVRVLAATNVDVHEAMKTGKFREDLYYRLNVVPVSTPALRERLGDIPLLASHFIRKICRQENIPPRRLAPQTLEHLAAYRWPGNVRQLENAVERAIALSGDREVLYASDFELPSAAAPPAANASSVSDAVALPETGLDFEQTVEGIGRRILEQAMRKSGGNKTAAAEMLGLKRTTLAAKLKSLEASACT